MVTATHINYYYICRRKLWLFGNGVNMEHTSDLVTEGKLVHEISYPNRAARYEEVRIGGSVIDFYDPRERWCMKLRNRRLKRRRMSGR